VSDWQPADSASIDYNTAGQLVPELPGDRLKYYDYGPINHLHLGINNNHTYRHSNYSAMLRTDPYELWYVHFLTRILTHRVHIFPSEPSRVLCYVLRSTELRRPSIPVLSCCISITLQVQPILLTLPSLHRSSAGDANNTPVASEVGDVTSIFLETRAIYTAPVSDLWYKAEKSVHYKVGLNGNVTDYGSEDPVKVMGCVEKFQICNPKFARKRFILPTSTQCNLLSGTVSYMQQRGTTSSQSPKI
jgi:hypothetical protein